MCILLYPVGFLGETLHWMCYLSISRCEVEHSTFNILTKDLEKYFNMHFLASCLTILPSPEATIQVFPTLCYD